MLSPIHLLPTCVLALKTPIDLKRYRAQSTQELFSIVLYTHANQVTVKWLLNKISFIRIVLAEVLDWKYTCQRIMVEWGNKAKEAIRSTCKSASHSPTSINTLAYSLIHSFNCCVLLHIHIFKFIIDFILAEPKVSFILHYSTLQWSLLINSMSFDYIISAENRNWERERDECLVLDHSFIHFFYSVESHKKYIEMIYAMMTDLLFNRQILNQQFFESDSNFILKI